MLKIKLQDNIRVVSGKDSGREGKVEKIVAGGKVLVPGINIYKKHVKGSREQKAGIYDIPRPLDISKVVLICPKCKKGARVGLKVIGSEKVRVCKKCGKEIDTK